MRVLRASVCALSFALILAGCARPDDRPAPVVTRAKAGWIEARYEAGPLAPDWWKALGDPRLDALITQALTASPDLTEAEARLRAARASVAAARGRDLPQINASGSASTNAQSANGMIPFGKLPGVSRTYNLFDAGFDAAWEVDLWGRQASVIRAATARGRLAEAQRDGTRLSLAAEVARTYIDLRSAQLRSANLARQVELLAAMLAMEQARVLAGEAQRNEELALRQRLEAARAAQGPVQAEAAANAYGLAVLTGQAPEAMHELLAETGRLPAAPAVTLLGLRSDVLTRRPDVRAALFDLSAARGDADAAHAALFPSLSLTGSIGQQARSGSDFTAANSLRYGFGPTLHWPLFAGGQLRAQWRGARAQADAAAARYEKAVLTALADSETAANRLARAVQSQDAADRAAQVADATAQLARQRYDRGEDNRLQALEAQLAALSAQASAVSVDTARAQAYIALGKALGAA